MRSTYKPTEHQLQTSIMNFLQYKGYYVMRLNSGALPIGEGVNRRIVRMSRKGTPDLMAFKEKYPGTLSWEMEVLFIEVKRPGKKATFVQEQMMKELEDYGAKCFVASSIEEVERQI